ncbi:hypothetical protein ZIOFF_067364 [Zingiber officinale]|uniref:Reverse transcriptase Ty1/copia-type domain-containing protein n=1 Tax=Zingiber officinale TaxID=94328 RepID=A0A8J5EUM9_ZINOF|nr:hypothetical protein ZIOFF_067364 [Zingiber officinale]
MPLPPLLSPCPNVALSSLLSQCPNVALSPLVSPCPNVALLSHRRSSFTPCCSHTATHLLVPHPVCRARLPRDPFRSSPSPQSHFHLLGLPLPFRRNLGSIPVAKNKKSLLEVASMNIAEFHYCCTGLSKLLKDENACYNRSNPSMFGEFKEAMTKEFEMIDIGLMAYYLGIEVNQREDGSFISQAGYAREILKKFRMDNSNRYMEDPITTHLKIAKRILRYIKGTIDFGLLYSTSNHFKLEGYSDSDWGGDIDDRKSTTGFVFFMGDTTFTWMSKK